MEKLMITTEMLAFQLGFRTSLLLGANKENLETLLQEILELTWEPKIMEAFHLGKKKGVEEKRVIEHNLKYEAKEREAFIKELEQKSLSGINFKK